MLSLPYSCERIWSTLSEVQLFQLLRRGSVMICKMRALNVKATSCDIHSNPSDITSFSKIECVFSKFTTKAPSVSEYYINLIIYLSPPLHYSCTSTSSQRHSRGPRSVIFQVKRHKKIHLLCPATFGFIFFGCPPCPAASAITARLRYWSHYHKEG